MSDETLSIINLEYSFINEPTGTSYYQSNIGLWNNYYKNSSSGRIMDNLGAIHQAANQININQLGTSNYITVVEPQPNYQMISICLNGSPSFINESRMIMLQTYNQLHFKTIHITNDEFLTISHKFTDHLVDICRQYQVEMIINDHLLDNSPTPPNQFYIHIIGNQDNITIAEPSIRILISNILHGDFLDSVEIELSLIPLIGGIDLFNFNQIAKQSSCNIYIPDLLPNLFNSGVLGNTANLKIWFTAKTMPQLLLAKHILTKLINDKRSNGAFVVKEITVLKPKIDAIVLYNQSQILNIMFKHGIFIQLPSLGEPNNYTISVQGSSVDSVNEAIDEINLLCSSYYSVKFDTFNASNFSESFLLRLIQFKKTCTLTRNASCIEICGSSNEIKQVLNPLALNSNVAFTTSSLRLELNVNQRDFISGKKNGKLIKILNQLNQLPMIKFKPFNEYNFFIDVETYEGTDLSVLVKAIELIELELPAELQFNIPEVFHKSIIGNGGSIIQSIMKKYNVFIKFSNKVADIEDGYSFKRYNNVLIKCPRKNGKNINLVKYEIDQLVYQCWNNGMGSSLTNATTTVYHTVKFQLLKSHYLLMINNNKLNHINSLESSHNSFVNFPTSIEKFATKNDLMVEIKGSEIKSKQCFRQLMSILPQNYEFKITFMPGKFDETFADGHNHDFVNRVMIPFKILLGIEMIVNETPIVNKNTNSEETYHQIILSYYDDKHLSAGVQDLTTYLREKGFLILDKRSIDYDPVVEFSGLDNAGSVFSPVKRKSMINTDFTSPTKPNGLKSFNNLEQVFRPLVPITNQNYDAKPLYTKGSVSPRREGPRKFNGTSPRKEKYLSTPVKQSHKLMVNFNEAFPMMNPPMIRADGGAGIIHQPMNQYVHYIA